MKFITIKKWKKDSSLAGLLFFAQRMVELLFDYTLDTYKPSALNAPFLCSEALRLISDVEQGLIDAKNIDPVLDELVWSLKNDFLAKSLLETDIEKYVLRHEQVKLTEQKLRLEVLSVTLNPNRYLLKCHELLRTAVNDSEKKNIDFLARTLCTTLINMGLSKTYLYNKTLSFFFHGDSPQTIDSTSAIDKFLKEDIFPMRHEFDFFFIVSDLVKQLADSVKSFDIEIVEQLPEDVLGFAERNDFKLLAGQTFVKLSEIDGCDIYSAQEQAERRLDQLSDLYTLFHHKAQISWDERKIASCKCCADKLQIIGKSKSSMEKGFDSLPAVASKRLNWLIQNLGLSKEGSFQKFNRVVDLHGICITNEIPENQLLNLWISLETVTPIHAGRSKINNIIHSLLPAIMTNYIKRLIDRLAADLLLWNQEKTKVILKRIPDDNLKKKKISTKVLLLLSLNEHEELRKELYSYLGDFHLLRFRVYSLSEILKSPDKVKDLLTTHYQKVSWQLHRIYRVRNLIVHSGRSLPYIHTLIENGHDYLDQTLWEVMRFSCDIHDVRTFEQAFELFEIRYEQFNKNLSQTSSFDKNNLIFLYDF